MEECTLTMDGCAWLVRPSTGTDFIVRSRDNVLFYLHTCYLLHTTGWLLPTTPAAAKSICSNEQHKPVSGDSSTGDDKVGSEVTTASSSPRPTAWNLPEPREVLEVLFDFIYPRRHPDLTGMLFSQLLPLADAAEKYKVYSAMAICQMCMRKFILTNPIDVFRHTSKYGYPSDIVAEAAIHCSRLKIPFDTLMKTFPKNAISVWFKLQEVWTKIFNEEFDISPNKPSSPSSPTPTNSKSKKRKVSTISTPTPTAVNPLENCICCRGIVFMWKSDLEGIKNYSVLLQSILAGCPRECLQAIETCSVCTPAAKSENKVFVTTISKKLHERIWALTKDTEFLEASSQPTEN
ncbi:hypothetical protein CPC08DRAFT_479447 [Agrocybe pediades]|nr:hypothetical protein CPC08DRAFT_479447 [Agrocybe pediades]